MRRATSGARSTVFVVEPDRTLRALNPGPDVERLAREIDLPDSDRTPGAAVVPLRGAQQVLGYCVVVGVPRWTDELADRAREVADDFALRLDTAVLFDDVRTLATSEERNRIAREMHDGVAQEIVALGYIVDEIESISDQDQTRELASVLRAEITRLVSEIRFSIFDLRHQVTDGRVASSLADYARAVSIASGLRVHLSLAESGPPLSPRTATEVLRVAQEAIGNVRKHANAENLWLTFESDGTMLQLEVEDDGVGNAGPREHHWGLQTMRERAEGVGARLDVCPRQDGGTVVSLRSTVTTPREGGTAHGHHRATG
nr:histidine kinase [Nocardioides sp. zg-1230]